MYIHNIPADELNQHAHSIPQLRRLSDMLPEHMDDGLTWAWALYWSASQPGSGSNAVDTTWATGPTDAAEEMCEAMPGFRSEK